MKTLLVRDRIGAGLMCLLALSLAMTSMAWRSSNQSLHRMAATATMQEHEVDQAHQVRYLDEALTHSVAEFILSKDPKWKDRYDNDVTLLDAAIKDLSTTAPKSALQPLDEVADANTKLIDMETKIFQLVSDDKQSEAEAILNGDYQQQKSVYSKGVQRLLDGEQQRATSAMSRQRSQTNVERTITTILSVILVGLVAAIALAHRRQRTVMSNVAARLRRTASSMIGSSVQLGTTSRSTTERGAEIGASSQLVSDTVGEVSVAVEQLTASVDEVARSAQGTNAAAQEAVEAAASSHARIAELNETTSTIGSIVEAITSIAEQTNLLALNATIEAARAGEAGKGFAVVANEVKDLAQQTATATTEIQERIALVQSQAAAAVSSVERISVKVNEAAHMQASVSAAVEEQSAVTQAISQNVVGAAHMSAGISGQIEEVIEAARSTAQVADHTQELAAELDGTSVELSALLGHDAMRHTDGHAPQGRRPVPAHQRFGVRPDGDRVARHEEVPTNRW